MLCRLCGEDKPEDGFFVDRAKASGRASSCKDCRRVYHRTWRERPESKIKMKRYYANYRPTPEVLERRREASRLSHARDWKAGKGKEAARIYAATRYPQVRERKIAQALAWNRAHPDQRSATQVRRRAEKRGLEAETVLPSIVYAKDNFMCQLCGEPTEPEGPYGRRPSIDHIIPLSLGGPHTYENTQTAHRSCNSGKGNRVLDDTVRLSSTPSG
jgi:5-methylcytosine-specific restriction endonuclease McrA